MKRAGFFFFLFLILCAPSFAFADASSDSQQLASLEAEITAYQKQLEALGAKKITLQSTIDSLTIYQKKLAAQIKITQSNIASANLKIKELTTSIGNKEAIIVTNQNAIAKVLRGIAQDEENSFITQIISSNSLRDAWQAADTALQFNRALANNITDLRVVREELTANRDEVTKAKGDLVSLQTQLTAQNKSIAQSKNQQQQLLAQTKNSESSFQKLLAAAKAELASFSAFAAAAGGSKLLTNQTVCDAWGCYYNQRDALWGNLPLNGTQYRLASDGCLVTAMAMVLTHYGYRDITPVTINSNPNNFAAYYPAYLLFTTYVDGIIATRVTALIDATLASGNPAIIGLRAYGGTHFVVFVSGNSGSYLMRDPYIANGKDINFSDYYKVSNIYAVNKVIISQ